jgi:hypothetical protein
MHSACIVTMYVLSLCQVPWLNSRHDMSILTGDWLAGGAGCCGGVPTMHSMYEHPAETRTLHPLVLLHAQFLNSIYVCTLCQVP